jgi:hypothetical protein
MSAGIGGFGAEVYATGGEVKLLNFADYSSFGDSMSPMKEIRDAILFSMRITLAYVLAKNEGNP